METTLMVKTLLALPKADMETTLLFIGFTFVGIVVLSLAGMYALQKTERFMD